MKRGTIVTIVGFLIFGAVLVLSTLRSQRAECTVTIEFNGLTNTATASAETEDEAARQAQTTACGTIAAGMDQTIACGNRVPVRRECRSSG